MKIGLLVEGYCDKKVIPVLAHKILERNGKSSPVEVCFVRQGDMFNSGKVYNHIDAFLRKHPDIEKILLCVDSECTPIEKTKERLSKVEKELKDRGVGLLPEFCIVKHALEGWLAADAQAVAEALQIRESIKLGWNPEEECRPKEKLKETLSKYGKNFDCMRDDLKIAEFVEPSRIRNSSFEEFQKMVEDP